MIFYVSTLLVTHAVNKNNSNSISIIPFSHKSIEFIENIIFDENDALKAAESDEIVTDETNACLKLIIKFCEIYNVPSVYFSVATNEGNYIHPEKIWRNIFKEKNFVGKISYEQCSLENGFR